MKVQLFSNFTSQRYFTKYCAHIERWGKTLITIESSHKLLARTNENVV